MKKEYNRLTKGYNYYLDSRSEFFRLADAIKLTSPQKRILEILRDGDRITTINPHYMSGGSWIWEQRGDIGGKLYRPFWNLMYAVLRPSGYEVNVKYLNFIK